MQGRCQIMANARPIATGGTHSMRPPALPHLQLQLAVSRSQRQRQETLTLMTRASANDADAAGRDMASEFAAYVLNSGAASPTQRRKPSHLMPPTEVVAAQLDALQRNDWPEPDAGVRSAFAFSKPAGAEELLPGQVSGGQAAAWGGTERWLSFEEFNNQLHRPPYAVLLGCDSWRLTSPMAFPRQRAGERALQAVEVQSLRQTGDAGGGLRPYQFTFCLERVDGGPYKGCWMTVGLRCGDYATV